MMSNKKIARFEGINPMSLVTANNLSKTYALGELKVDALKELNFEIDPASFVSFVGPSGSGKTTLLNLIGCLDKPTSGTLTVDGTDISSLNTRIAAAFRGRKIGFIFQDFNLIPVLTVYENVGYPLLMVQNTPATERKKRINALLEAVGMADKKDKYPDQISGGQKQRVAVARALVKKPDLVLADEPTANLDSKTGENILNLMLELNRKTSTTFIYSTHDNRVMRLASRLILLKDGQLESDSGNGNQ